MVADATSSSSITNDSTNPINITDQIAAHLRHGVSSWCRDHEVTTEDVLRIYQDQISNMVVTEQIRSALKMDPFQQLKENIPSKCMDGIINSIRVVSHHSVKTMEGYVRTEAIIALSSHDFESNTSDTLRVTSKRSSKTQFNKKRPRTHPSGTSNGMGEIKLRFTYVRTSMTSINPCTVSYTIDVCSTAASNGTHDHRPKPLLWVHIYAAGVVPSSHDTSHAININNADNTDDDDQWSDTDDDEEEENVQCTNEESIHCDSISRHASTGSCNSATQSTIFVASVNDETKEIKSDKIIKHSENSSNSSSNQKQNKDRFEAGMDPDVVAILVSHLVSLSSDNDENVTTGTFADITMFFFLMTFPFYEHEWDLVGFLLQAVFDSDSIDGSDDE